MTARVHIALIILALVGFCLAASTMVSSQQNTEELLWQAPE